MAARFTLDGMPGKQMAIDADLASGVIDEDEARRRRKEIADEADFYGAMDGASKFVRGDAIAAIVITMVNLIGGPGHRHLPAPPSSARPSTPTASCRWATGWSRQIPALLLSLSTGIIVTRAATEHDLGHDVVTQLSRFPADRADHRLIMALLALVPGLPKLPFLIIGGSSSSSGPGCPRRRVDEKPDERARPRCRRHPRSRPRRWPPAWRWSRSSLELGVDLIDLVQPDRGGDLLDRVKALRRNIAMELGIVMPRVHTRDNLDLPNADYAIKVHGVEVARGAGPAGKLLAIGREPRPAAGGRHPGPGLRGSGQVDPGRP